MVTDDEEAYPEVALGVASASEAGAGPTFPAEPPFGPEFFRTVLADRVRERCADRDAEVPVVELRLADGTTLDVCHIPTIDRLWFSVEAFRDAETCEGMDLVFVPFETVTRVTISTLPPDRRPLGFRLPA